MEEPAQPKRQPTQKELDAAREEKAELTRVYEATIKDLKAELDSRPKFSKEVLDVAQSVVDRWTADAAEAHKSLRARLDSTSSGQP